MTAALVPSCYTRLSGAHGGFLALRPTRTLAWPQANPRTLAYPQAHLLTAVHDAIETFQSETSEKVPIDCEELQPHAQPPPVPSDPPRSPMPSPPPSLPPRALRQRMAPGPCYFESYEIVMDELRDYRWFKVCI